MGLDMYLSATKYVSGYGFEKQKVADTYDKVLNALGMTRDDLGDPGTPSANVEVNVAYWRKSNAIHAWFVDNCQGGEDDCNKYPVYREQLQELVDLCKKVIANPNDAPNLLKTRSGFFFGSTDYDEYFFDDIRNTVTMLEKVLQNPKFADWSFEYHSSW